MNDSLEYDDFELPAPEIQESTPQFIQRMMGETGLDQHRLRCLWVRCKKNRDEAVKRRRTAHKKIKFWMEKAKTEDHVILDADAKIFELEGQIFKT